MADVSFALHSGFLAIILTLARSDRSWVFGDYALVGVGKGVTSTDTSGQRDETRKDTAESQTGSHGHRFLETDQPAALRAER